MKASPATRARVAAILAPLDTAERRARYLAGDFPRADRVRNLDTRYRWDLAYASGGDWLYRLHDDEGLDGDHIDTLLRAVVPPLTAREG